MSGSRASVSGCARFVRAAHDHGRGGLMDNGGMWVSLAIGAFLLFGDPVEEAGLDWRSAVHAASVWVTGGEG